MGTLGDLGVPTTSIPKIDISGFFSNTWVYVIIIVLVGVFLIIGVLIFLFFLTYKKKIILFENISGQGYQPVLKTRARTIKLGVGGEELLKTLAGGHFVSAYGRKMGKNTFWYCKGQDGYWYNTILGDLDSKRAMLDIEPIDRDVRMFHVALDRLSHQTYNKQTWMERHGNQMIMFLFLVVLILGIWFIVGKIGEAVAPLGEAAETALEVQDMNLAITNQLAEITRNMGYAPITETTGGSGLAPAT